MDKPLRLLAVVNVPWDPRLGAARVWIELTEEWCKAGHHVEKFCLTDAFPEPASSPGHAALRLLGFPQRAGKFIRENAERFDVIDALIGTLPVSKKVLGFRGLLVARSVGLYHLYEKFERMAATRWPASGKGSLLGRPFYWFFNQRARAASRAAVQHCDLLNLPNGEKPWRPPPLPPKRAGRKRRSHSLGCGVRAKAHAIGRRLFVKSAPACQGPSFFFWGQ